MPSSTRKPLLLIYGATGATGQLLVEGLLQSGTLRLGVVSRSAATPLLARWRARGVALHTLDVGTASGRALGVLLAGAAFLVSVCGARALDTQRALFAAAARAGVRRLVPSDFAPACPRGVALLQDSKLRIREYVRALGVPYTFVEAGRWAPLALPYPSGADGRGSRTASASRRVYGAGVTKCAVMDAGRLAELLVRILLDPRAENQTVFCWEDEVTQNETWAIAAREADEGPEISELREIVSPERLEAEIATAKAAHAKNPSWTTIGRLATTQYQLSLHIRGDNTRAKAIAAGALDALQLYPDFVPVPLAEYAKSWYRAPMQVLCES